MILAESLIEDETNRAEIVKEFISVACIHTGIESASSSSGLTTSTKSTLKPSKKDKMPEKSNVAKGKMASRATSKNKSALSCSSCTPSPELEFPTHMSPFISYLKKHKVDLSKTDDSILEYIIETCMDDHTEDVDLAEVVCSYFPELPKYPLGVLVGALRCAARECRDAASEAQDCSAVGEGDVVRRDGEEEEGEEGGEESEEEEGEEEVCEDVEELLAVFPHVPIDVLQYVCNVKFTGNRVDAGQFLIENCSSGEWRMPRHEPNCYNK
jgi:hypothetical protein